MAATNVTQCLDLVQSIYEMSLVQPDEMADGWSMVIRRFAELSQATLGALFFRDVLQASSTLRVIGQQGYPDSAIDAYGRHYAGMDDEAVIVTGLAAGQRYLVTPETFARRASSEIYTDYFKPIGGGQGVGFKIFDDDGRFCMLSLHRHFGARPITADDMDVMTIIVAHIRRALQVQRQLVDIGHLNRSLYAALDHLPDAIFVIDRQAKPLSMNRAADRLLSRPSGPFRLKSGRLEPFVADDAARFLMAIARSSGQSTMHLATPEVILDIGGRDQGRYRLMLSPVPSNWCGWPTEPLHLLFVSEPSRRLDGRMADIAKRSGFTDAEVDVGILLSSGNSVEEIAARRAVGTGTVRTQVKSLLGKTGTHSQAQFVSCVFGAWQGEPKSPR